MFPWLPVTDESSPDTIRHVWLQLTKDKEMWIAVFRKHWKLEKRQWFSWAHRTKEISAFPSRAVRLFTKPHIFILRCTSVRLQDVRRHGRIWPLTCSAANISRTRVAAPHDSSQLQWAKSNSGQTLGSNPPTLLRFRAMALSGQMPSCFMFVTEPLHSGALSEQ